MPLRDGERCTAGADLVVGADGLNSAVRSRLWPQSPGPVYAGSTAWRGVTRERWDGELVVGISWAPGAEFGIVPLGDGRVYWYAAVNARSGQRAPDEMAAVRDRFGSWHEPIPALLDATAASAVLRADIFCLDTPLPGYVRSRVALLGDAAHAMTPNLGQGACQAVEDAVVLGIVCDLAAEPEADDGSVRRISAGGRADRGDELAAALAAYDGQRRPRTQRMARASRRVGRFGQQLENPLAVALRDGAMRLTPPRMALRSMASHADWVPPTRD